MALTASGLTAALPTPIPGQWQLTADRKVGTLWVGQDLQVSVRPKVTIERLVFMMGYARNPSYWQDNPVTLARHDDLPEALAHTFQRLATKALEQGLLHGYRTVDDSLHVIRGRIRTDDQLRLRFQMPLPVEVRYDDFTTDITENQILLTTALRLLHLPQLPADLRAGLHRMRSQLADVEPIRRGTALPLWQPSRLNARYQPALHVADLILASSSFEQQHGDTEVEVSGFVFDTWKIFEDFVCAALAEAMANQPGYAVLQHRGRLDADGAIPIEPDFTWWDGQRTRTIVDAKYKAGKSSSFPNADIYQVLAYCTALGIHNGHLIYAKGEADPRTYQVMRSPIKIHCHAIDLAENPPGLLAQINTLAGRIWHAPFRPGYQASV